MSLKNFSVNNNNVFELFLTVLCKNYIRYPKMIEMSFVFSLVKDIYRNDIYYIFEKDLILMVFAII